MVKISWRASTESVSLNLNVTQTCKYDSENNRLALYSVIRSLLEEMNESQAIHGYIKKKSDQDNTWRFWARFVFEDCLPYIVLFMAIRSENWELRMASLKQILLP